MSTHGSAGIVAAAQTAMTNFKPKRAIQARPRSQRHAPPVTSLLPGDVDDLHVGSVLAVTAIRLMGGAIVLDVATEAGAALCLMLC